MNISINKETLKTKTFWTGIIGLVTAVAGGFTGEMDMSNAIQTGILSLLSIFLRDGLTKKTN